MLNEAFIGNFTSVTTKTKKAKNEEGEKVDIKYKKVHLVSSSIDYSEIAKTFPNIYATIIATEPPSLKNANFGEQTIYGMNLKLRLHDSDEYEYDSEWYQYDKVNIKNIKVVNDAGILKFHFDLEFEISTNDKYLDKMIGDVLEVIFVKENVEE